MKLFCSLYYFSTYIKILDLKFDHNVMKSRLQLGMLNYPEKSHCLFHRHTCTILNHWYQHPKFNMINTCFESINFNEVNL